MDQNQALRVLISASQRVADTSAKEAEIINQAIKAFQVKEEPKEEKAPENPHDFAKPVVFFCAISIGNPDSPDPHSEREVQNP